MTAEPAIPDLIEALGPNPLIGLDFDGTLSEIAPTPDEAVVLPAAREALAALAGVVVVCVLSGRDPDDVRVRVGVPAVAAFAGSHGLDVTDGEGRPLDDVPGPIDLLPVLDRIEGRLRGSFAQEPGVIVERKRFGVAVHHRLAPDAAERVLEATTALAEAAPGMRVVTGKAVAEIRPDASGKGETLGWLAKRFGPFSGVFYVGDDTTDEDAFAAIASEGVGVLVAADERPTAAGFRVPSPDRLAEILSGLADAYRRP